MCIPLCRAASQICESRSRLHQHTGRLTRPRRLTNATDDSPVRPRDRFTRPHRFTNAAANSSVQQKNTTCNPFYVFCQHILNHPSKTTLPCCILYAGKLPVAKWHHTVEMGTCQTLFGTCGCPYSTDSRTGLQCCGRLSRPHRFTVLRLTHL